MRQRKWPEADLEEEDTRTSAWVSLEYGREETRMFGEAIDRTTALLRHLDRNFQSIRGDIYKVHRKTLKPVY